MSAPLTDDLIARLKALAFCDCERCATLVEAAEALAAASNHTAERDELRAAILVHVPKDAAMWSHQAVVGLALAHAEDSATADERALAAASRAPQEPYPDFTDDVIAEFKKAGAEAFRLPLEAIAPPTQSALTTARVVKETAVSFNSTPPAAPPPDWQTAALLKERTRRAIRERVAAGEPRAEAAYDYGVPVAFVDHLVQWELFKEELPAATPPWQPIEPELDYCQLLKRAKVIVNESVLYRRFIDGTPLENDLTVWMADFVLASIRTLVAEGRIQGVPLPSPPASAPQPAEEEP